MSLPTTDSSSFPALDATLQAVNWDFILRTVRHKLGSTTVLWGEQKSGSFNLVRFLHLDDQEVVVRIPLYPDPELVGPMTPDIMDRNVRKTSSMIASMEYVAAHTSIPVPRIIHACLNPELGDVRSPYVVMTKVEGSPLSNYWDDMPDKQRDCILEQVIDILFELSTLRFDKIGSLFKTKDGDWRIEPSPPENTSIDNDAKVTYASGTDQFLAIANACLQKIQYHRFGYIGNEIDYTQYWFMRSLIPCLYDNSLDVHGFPLMHGDFHSQNIYVVDVDKQPRVTAIIDWDDTMTMSTSSFAQYPFFIVDHPLWPEDHPLRTRNVRDQASFNRLVEKAEQDADITPSLSRAFSNCYGLYLFEQCIRDERMYNALFWELVRHIFGPDGREKGWYHYRDGLERGILKDIIKKFEEEADVADEAKEVLGNGFTLDGLTREAFIELVKKHSDRFSPEGQVFAWLKKVNIDWN